MAGKKETNSNSANRRYEAKLCPMADTLRSNELGLGLRVTREAQFAPVGGGHTDVDTVAKFSGRLSG